MKVLILADGIHPITIGGMQKHTLNLVNNLIQSNIEVEVATCYYNEESIENIELFFDCKIHFFKFPISHKFPGHYVYNSILFSKTLFSFYKTRLDEFDIIYSQGFTSFAFLKLTHTPIVSNLHGLEMFQLTFSIKGKLQNFILRQIAKYIIRNSSFSESLGGRLTNILREKKAKKILVGGNAVDADWLSNSSGITHRRNFLFVGRNDKRKGFDVIRKIFDKKSSDIYSLTVVGFDLKNNLAPNINYLGKIVSEIDLISIYDQHKFLLMNSYSEGLPTVIIEAMSRGLVVIASDVGATCEIVNEKNGFLFKPGDVIGLTILIEKAINLNEEEYCVLSRNAMEQAKNFTWDHLIKRYVKEFKRIIDER